MKKRLHALTLVGLSILVFSCQKTAKDDVAQASTSQNKSAQKVPTTFNLLETLVRGGGGGADGGGGDPCKSCSITYPDSSNIPMSLETFSESDCLVGASPGPLTCGNATEIKLWYADEHALTLGVRRVIVKTQAGTTITDYPLSPTPGVASVVYNPQVGTTIQSGDQNGNDAAAGGGRALWPSIFVTDLTVNGALSRIGDWQQGGHGYSPSIIYGTWKGAVKTVDKTHSTATTVITPDADPQQNHWNLAGGDAPPAGVPTEGYSAEVVWKMSDLGLISGHRYRLEFMVHDGDQNKVGGDAGEACTVIVAPRVFD